MFAAHRACIVLVSHTIYDKYTSIDCIDHHLLGLYALIDKEVILLDRYVIQILIFCSFLVFFCLLTKKCTEVLAVMFFSTFLSHDIYKNTAKQTK